MEGLSQIVMAKQLYGYALIASRTTRGSMETKQCLTCLKTKPITEYHKKSSGKYGVSSWCKVCINAYHRKNYTPHPRPKKIKVVKTEKRCATCYEVKDRNSFASKFVRSCFSCKSMETTDRKEYNQVWQKQRNIKVKQFIFNYLSNNPCVKCGETDVMVLEFDHMVAEQKSFNLGRAHMQAKMNIDTLAKEIAKCQVLCSNCHKRKTAQEQKSWRWLMSNNELPIK